MKTKEHPVPTDAALPSLPKAQNRPLKTPQERANIPILTHVTPADHDRFIALHAHYKAGRKISLSAYVRLKLLGKGAVGDLYPLSLTVHHFEQLLKLNNELLNTLKVLKNGLSEINLSSQEIHVEKEANLKNENEKNAMISEWLNKAES